MKKNNDDPLSSAIRGLSMIFFFFLFEDVDDDYDDADDQEEDGYGDIYGSGVVKTDTVDS